MALRDIRLWLHDGTPAGARTVFEGDAFVSILGADDAAREALALLGGREAVTVFAGPDAMPGRLVAAVVSGDVREAAAGCLPENGRTPFTSVVVLGAPGAAHLEYAVRAAVASSGGVTFLDGVEAQEGAERPHGLPNVTTSVTETAPARSPVCRSPARGAAHRPAHGLCAAASSSLQGAAARPPTQRRPSSPRSATPSSASSTRAILKSATASGPSCET